MRILGIDPGLGRCGFGLIEARPGQLKLLDFGVITTVVDAPIPSRLHELYDSLAELLDQTKPDVLAVEKLFFAKNITTGIVVAEARGVILLAAEQAKLLAYEYTPNEIKKTLTGYGSADKSQMEEMVKLQLGLETRPKPDDAADALAAAITCSLLYREGQKGSDHEFSNSRNRHR